jgi:hypothetical protein
MDNCYKSGELKLFGVFGSVTKAVIWSVLIQSLGDVL